MGWVEERTLVELAGAAVFRLQGGVGVALLGSRSNVLLHLLRCGHRSGCASWLCFSWGSLHPFARRKGLPCLLGLVHRSAPRGVRTVGQVALWRHRREARRRKVRNGLVRREGCCGSKSVLVAFSLLGAARSVKARSGTAGAPACLRTTTARRTLEPPLPWSPVLPLLLLLPESNHAACHENRRPDWPTCAPLHCAEVHGSHAR